MTEHWLWEAYPLNRAAGIWKQIHTKGKRVLIFHSKLSTAFKQILYCIYEIKRERAKTYSVRLVKATELWINCVLHQHPGRQARGCGCATSTLQGWTRPFIHSWVHQAGEMSTEPSCKQVTKTRVGLQPVLLCVLAIKTTHTHRAHRHGAEAGCLEEGRRMCISSAGNYFVVGPNLHHGQGRR